jgi:hypothetical protein
MDSGKVSNWLQIGANIGILLGLLLVAIQIRQGTDIAKAQIENDFYLADLQLELAMMGEQPQKSWIKAVYAPEEMTKEDAAVVDRYLNYNFIQLGRLERMRELGLSTDADRVGILEWHLGNEVARRWWAFNKKVDSYTSELKVKIDEVLERAPSKNPNRDLLNAMLTTEVSE